MSTWDEKASEQDAYRKRCPGGLEDVEAFDAGVTWLSEQLLSGETVERVAWRISERRQCGDCDLGGSPVVCSSCWEDAMAVLTAALGEEK